MLWQSRLFASVGVVFLALALRGDTATFDVASIKPAAVPVNREGGNRCRIEHSPTSLTMLNVSLADCVQWAYGVDFYQLSGQHLDGDSYDILAKTGTPVPVGHLRLMLQDLLAKRFQLALHRETKPLPVFELVIAKGGPKLPKPNEGAPVHAAESLPRVRNGNFVFDDNSMTEFADKLSKLRGIDLPVIDRTGIQGTYDIVLKSAATAILQPDGPSLLFAILQDQLGLKLTQAKAPIQVLVIDYARKPNAN